MSSEKLTRALGYPYALPGVSYIVENGTSRPISHDEAPAWRHERTPVLAVGSNQSPVQIARKFQGAEWSPIPCERCRVRDFDTVYSAHVTAYGSIAAALHPSPGTSVALYVNWLDVPQLQRMHDTELGNENYAFARLDGIEIETDFGHTLESIHFYVSRAGAYAPAPAREPIPLAEVDATDRQWTAMRQADIQRTLHAEAGTETTLDAFILRSIDDIGLRQRRKSEMSKTALPFEYSGLTVLATGAKS